MPVESAADRAAFLNPDEFGVTMTWALGDGSSVDIDAYFDEPSERIFDGPGITTAAPSIVVRTADVPEGATFGEHTPDRITIGERTFVPRTNEPDSTGMTTVMLEEID